MLKESLVVRGSRAAAIQTTNGTQQQEWIPWTCASGPPPEGLRSILIRQYHVTLDKGVPVAEDDNVKGQLFQQLVELADLILDGYRTQLESFPEGGGQPRKAAVAKQFEKDRSSIISPLREYFTLLLKPRFLLAFFEQRAKYLSVL